MALASFKNPSPYEARLREEFAARGDAAGSESAWNAFAAAGLPHRRLEGWRWTDLRGALAEAGGDGVAAPSVGLSIEDALVIDIPDGEARIHNASGVEGLSIRLTSDRDGPFAPSHAVSDLTRAFVSDIVRIDVAENAHIDRPILLRHRAAGGRRGARVELVVADGASVAIFETVESGDASFHHLLMQADVGAGAKLTRAILQAGAASSVVAGVSSARLGKDARLDQASILLGGKLARLETRLNFVGEGASASMDSAVLVGGARHADITTVVAHEAPGCETRQRHKGVADGKARAVFQGKFFVARDGQRTDADMQANALLLSDGAQANHKPELEIYADDVECAHGSTCGALDDEALFYLRQRGLSEAAARALLIEAFVGEVIDDMDARVAPAARAIVEAWLEERQL